MEDPATSSRGRVRRIVGRLAVVVVALGVPTLVLVGLAAGGDVGALVGLVLMALLAVPCTLAARQQRRERRRAT